MAGSFEVKEAAELLDSGFVAKWQERRALDPLARTVLRTILQQFVESGGPVRGEELAMLLPAHDPGEVNEAAARLDEKDLIVVQEGRVIAAYPLAGIPTAFTVVLPDGGERYAVCAIDALGIPAMLGQLVTIRSHCHHCREPLEIHAGPDGPIGGAEVMVWVGEGGEPRSKSYTSR